MSPVGAPRTTGDILWFDTDAELTAFGDASTVRRHAAEAAGDQAP